MTDAILEQVWRLPRGESHFVTVVVPEAFRKESILEQFRHPHQARPSSSGCSRSPASSSRTSR